MKLKLKLGKKGEVFGQLAALGVGIATLAIVLVVTFLILSQGVTQIKDIEGLDPNMVEANSSSLSWNATTELKAAVDDIPGWVPLIVIASIGAILLGLVAMFSRR